MDPPESKARKIYFVFPRPPVDCELSFWIEDTYIKVHLFRPLVKQEELEKNVPCASKYRVHLRQPTKSDFIIPLSEKVIEPTKKRNDYETYTVLQIDLYNSGGGWI